MQKIKPIIINKIWGYEVWLHSPLKQNQSIIENGSLITKGPLIKIIKANKPLSVQVHPDDVLAKELENEENGKAECWYVLEASSDSNFVVGINEFNKDIIKKHIQEGKLEKLLKYKIAKKGDFINIPAGLVHSVGANSKVLEVQQPSDTTYRMYDFNRIENGKLRELHIEKSLKSIQNKTSLLEPISINPLEYKTENNYSIKIMNEPSKLLENSIIVDLIQEVAYLGVKNDNIEFINYAIIKY